MTQFHIYSLYIHTSLHTNRVRAVYYFTSLATRRRLLAAVIEDVSVTVSRFKQKNILVAIDKQYSILSNKCYNKCYYIQL